MSNSIPTGILRAAFNEVKISLEDDLCSYSWLRHLIEPLLPLGVDLRFFVKAVLYDLLKSGIEIGQTFKTTKNGKGYVGFRAWKGSVEGRIERALNYEEPYSNSEHGWSFALCLPQNVDEYEPE